MYYLIWNKHKDICPVRNQESISVTYLIHVLTILSTGHCWKRRINNTITYWNNNGECVHVPRWFGENPIATSIVGSKRIPIIIQKCTKWLSTSRWTTCFITMGEYQLAQQLERGPTWYPPPSFLPPERDCRTGSIIQTEKASTLLNNQNFVTFIKSSTTMSSAGIVLMNQTEAYIPEDYFEAIAQFLDYTCIFWEPWLGQLTRYIWNSKKPKSWCREVEIAGLFRMDRIWNLRTNDVDILFKLLHGVLLWGAATVFSKYVPSTPAGGSLLAPALW